MDGIQILFWLVLAPFGLFATKSVFKDNREKHGSIAKATAKTAKDLGQFIFFSIVCVAGLLLFLMVINGMQSGVESL